MNPFGFAYSSTEGVEAFAKQGRIIVTGRGNRFDPKFQAARKLGVELWAYWNVQHCPDNLSNPQDAWQFLIAGKLPPLWPYRDKNGQPRSNWSGAHLLDIRPGSDWVKHIVAKTGELIERRMHDGLMLDSMAARVWSQLAAWDTWTVEEQSLWARSCVALARLIAEECARHSPVMKICHNGNWVLPASHPSYTAAQEGEKYCNGVMIENPSGDAPPEFWKAYANRKFGLLPRRVMAVDTTDAEALAWSKVPGVTHVCSVQKATGETYAKLTPPVLVGDGADVTPPPPVDETAVLRAQVAELTTANVTLQEQLNESRRNWQASEFRVALLTAKIEKIDAEIHA